MAKQHNLNLKLGKTDAVIQQWLDLQSNKSWAIKFLVKQAIHHYGMQDLQTVLENSLFAPTSSKQEPIVVLPAAESSAEVKKITESFTF